MQEILKRNKAKKEKKVTYEIIDKFYTLTEIRGKKIKKLERKIQDYNKNQFYGERENSNYNAYNTKININSTNYANNKSI